MILLLAHLFVQSSAMCCSKKTVGSVSYTLTPELLENEELPSDCIDDCIYTQDGTTNRVCFRKGDLMFECGENDCTSTSDRGSGPMDYWPLVKDAAKCRNDHCSKESTTCFAEGACNETMNCAGECNKLGIIEDIITCTFECQKAMATNKRAVGLLRCLGEHHCQEMRPDDGGCKAKNPREGVMEINNLGNIEGVWWTVMAWECSTGKYNTAGADTNPCMMYKIDGASSLVCFDIKKFGSVTKWKKPSQASLAGPGILKTSHDKTRPYPFESVENHIVDYDDSYQLHIWCGGNQDARFNGAFVLSRNRTIDNINPETLDRFKANVKARGYDLNDSCTFDNADCTECTN